MPMRESRRAEARTRVPTRERIVKGSGKAQQRQISESEGSGKARQRRIFENEDSGKARQRRISESEGSGEVDNDGYLRARAAARSRWRILRTSEGAGDIWHPKSKLGR